MVFQHSKVFKAISPTLTYSGSTNHSVIVSGGNMADIQSEGYMSEPQSDPESDESAVHHNHQRADVLE